MAQRTVTLCDGKYIGIESIFTVIEGKQINIPDKLKFLKEKSRHNELYCPCGCGSNLILVASENSLREQHFRLKTGETNKDCQAITEGMRSIGAKIVLKCWLDDKLNDMGLESRVPVSDVGDTERRYEFTFLSRKNEVGLSYCHDRINLSAEKLKILTDNSLGIKLVHILDSCNFRAEGQYPEAEMKIQRIQGYCLLLDTGDESEYGSSHLKGLFYVQNIDGLWEEIEFCSDRISLYSFIDGELSYNGKAVSQIASDAKRKYEEKITDERNAREEERRRREACLKKQHEIEEQRKIEAEKRAEVQRGQLLERQRIKEEQRKAAELQTKTDNERYVMEHIDQQEKRVIDNNGIRWIKCEFCGRVAPDSDFSIYGGPKHINLGTCKACKENNPKAKSMSETKSRIREEKKKQNSDICPECGGKIIEKMGRYGRFFTCSNYPKCNYKPPKW